MTTLDTYLQALMTTARKPEFIGFTMDTAELYRLCIVELNKIVDMDFSTYLYQDAEESQQFYVSIDEYTIIEHLGQEEFDRINSILPFPIDEHWEVTDYLLGKIFKTGTWIHASVRYHDSSQVEIQIGVPFDI